MEKKVKINRSYVEETTHRPSTRHLSWNLKDKNKRGGPKKTWSREIEKGKKYWKELEINGKNSKIHLKMGGCCKWPILNGR